MPLPCPNVARALSLALLACALPGCSKHVREIAPAAAPAASGPAANVPPELVGVWTGTRGPVMRCLELHADGTYAMVPNAEAGDRSAFHGTWSVVGDQITWRDASQGFNPDVNPMVDVSDGHFTTLEADRSQTRFDRIATAPGAACPR